jgi:hypothetical protein
MSFENYQAAEHGHTAAASRAYEAGIGDDCSSAQYIDLITDAGSDLDEVVLKEPLDFEENMRNFKAALNAYENGSESSVYFWFGKVAAATKKYANSKSVKL